MTRIRVSNPIERDFGMVPRVLWSSPLPFAAKGVAAYLFCLRDGAFPYVAEMEAALGLGRDARRKAFAALESAGVIRWVIERDAALRIVGKTLVLLPDKLAELSRAPESQADGVSAALAGRAPEIPADGNSTPARVEFRPCSDGKSGDTLKDKYKRGATRARSASRQVPPLPGGGQAKLADPGACVRDLSLFVLSRVRSDQTVIVSGVQVLPGSADMAALRQAVRVQDALEQGVLV